MVGVLISMKVALTRHSATGPKATWMLTGALIGLTVAAGTISVATFEYGQPTALMDLLGVVLAIWMFGWMLGPAWTGQPVLRASHFSLEPVPRGRLAVGLLAAAFVGVGALVSLVAFASLVVFGARLGVVASVVVAVPAMLLQLVLVVLLARVTAWIFGAMARSRTGAVITGLITAAMLVVAQSGWLVFIAVDSVLATGFSPEVSRVLRALPSSWGLLAVEAASRSDWRMVAISLGGLVVLLGLLVLLWSWMLGSEGLSRTVVRGTADKRATARTATGAVYLKELRTWRRDALRVQNLVVAPAFAILTALLPLLFDSTSFLPFAGALAALMAAATCGNLYGQDGTALWLTLMTPGTERADVRGRQLAWLTFVAPISIALTVAGTLLHGDQAMWPWALAAVLATLGAGSGLIMTVGVDQLVPGPDPHKSKDSPLDHGDVTGQGFVMMLMVTALALPAVGTTVAGSMLGIPALLWGGVGVAVVTGLLYFWWLGRSASKHLAERASDLLYLMRSGKEQQARVTEGASVLKTMPRHRRALLWACFFIGCIALFPQGLVPLAMKVTGEIAPVWFLALHLPDVWQWPTIAIMIALGVLAFVIAGGIYLTETRAMRAKLAAAQAEREEHNGNKEPVPA
ncbi:hypothetical protein [Spongiactinospora sp. TRM90649]|uniref:hypothetical protein n=1 Tax=Spongiactinospora sp. TRM90649 TaxID=3031114 RepID=UPI0023F9DA17|nr:hypothetical protein [Spongiactinospora sp. TRM90649]MDF5757176.1 hypothetical protein [Spongiactinospora sp. TRM90649]